MGELVAFPPRAPAPPADPAVARNLAGLAQARAALRRGRARAIDHDPGQDPGADPGDLGPDPVREDEADA
jgi:hypothetical protein